MRALKWAQLEELALRKLPCLPDRLNGPTNAQATLRLFGQSEESVRVTLYRDNHAWCPYCQKVWLWLEEKRVPYAIKKVTMFCYGTKEKWYKKVVPSGMLPAMELDGRVITESDVLLQELEQSFGPLQYSMSDPKVVPLRRLERALFSAWCQWLCYPARTKAQELNNRKHFENVVKVVEMKLSATPGPFFLDEFSVADVVFVPYVERMNASLYYYKGYALRGEQNPNLQAWFNALEQRTTYLGTQSDFHTHAHDLPPQMGGCYSNKSAEQAECQKKVDHGPYMSIPEVGFEEPEDAKEVATIRVKKFKDNLLSVNPYAKNEADLDEAIRAALMRMMTGSEAVVPHAKGMDKALRYIRDRISVPRDMPIYSARRLRQALEATAAQIGQAQPDKIPTSHRKDQNPAKFKGAL